MAALQIVHAGLRKLSPATAYAVLALLWVRAFHRMSASCWARRRGRP
jgi:hypothetical protein